LKIKEYFVDVLTQYKATCCATYGICDTCQSMLKYHGKSNFNEMDRDDQPRCWDLAWRFMQKNEFYQTDIV